VFAIAGLLAVAVALPAHAFANNVGNAQSLPRLGGDVALTIPADGHMVYRISLNQGDWLIAYAWAPNSNTPVGQVRVLPPSATDVASDTVGVSFPNGILFFQAQATGNYYCDFAATGGSHITRGIFPSRPVLTLTTRSGITLPYNGVFTSTCVFDDPRYSYVPYDGTDVAFEVVTLSSSRDNVTFRPIWAGYTDISGGIGHKVKGFTRRTYLRWDYGGAIYDRAGFGITQSSVITILPRVKFTLRVPTSATHGSAFRVTGTIQPTCAPGQPSTVVEARKKGTSAILSFTMSAGASKNGSTPLSSSVTLASAGIWYVRLHRPTDTSNAETATKWVPVNVR
jgi:hypothetical protein